MRRKTCLNCGAVIEYEADFIIKWDLPFNRFFVYNTGQEILQEEDADDLEVCPLCGEVFDDDYDEL